MPDPEPKPSTGTPDNEIGGVNTLETWREVPPTHYILKIESFSSLVRTVRRTKLDSYESKDFEASGYNWKLLLYPDGDEKRNGSGHISLYLKIIDPVMEIEALLTFFIYDQHKDKYRSIQDMEVRRFTDTKKEWGFSQLVSLKCFRDNKNGYLIKDSCVFGVEVFVLERTRERVVFRTLKEQGKKAYIWNVEKVSGLNETGHFSEPFRVDGYCKWKLHLYRKGIPKEREKYLSIYLGLHNQNRFLPGWKMHVEFKLSINDQVDKNNSDKISKRGEAWFSALGTAWGFPYFIKWDDLERSTGLVVRDAMEIEVQIFSISVATEEYIDWALPGNTDDIPTDTDDIQR